jgi:hypothetical protein
MTAPDRPMAGAAAPVQPIEKARVFVVTVAANPRALRPHPVGGCHFREIPT